MLEYPVLAGAYTLGWYLFWRYKLKKASSRILAFHDILDKPDLSITRMSTSKFENVMAYLISRGLRGRSISGIKNENDIGLTFDDGWQSFYTKAFPILRKYGFTATVFIVSDYVGEKSRWDYQKKEHLSWPEVKTLTDEGIEIGSHSANHIDLRGLNDDKLEYEIIDSKKMIEDKIGRQIKYFSYPFGRFDRRVKEAIRKAGYEKAYALSIGDDEYSIARQCIYLYDTPYSIDMKLNRGI